MCANPQDTGPLSWADRMQFTWIAGVATLLMVALTPLHASAENAKVEAFSKTPHAEKINVNLLVLEDQVRQGAMSFNPSCLQNGDEHSR